jgi:hypothetical protein
MEVMVETIMTNKFVIGFFAKEDGGDGKGREEASDQQAIYRVSRGFQHLQLQDGLVDGTVCWGCGGSQSREGALPCVVVGLVRSVRAEAGRLRLRVSL